MSGLIGMIIVGFAAGSIAKYLTPQKENAGLLLTTGLGIAGAFVGGFIGRFLGVGGGGLISDIIFASLGAVIILFVYHKVKASKA